MQQNVGAHIFPDVISSGSIEIPPEPAPICTY
jgi:hypothetical protein